MGIALATDPDGAAWFYRQFRELYGWDVPSVDYTAPVETAVPWPAQSASTEPGQAV